MARTRLFSNSSRGRSRRRFGSNQSAVQQQQETESRDTSFAPESSRAVGGAENAGQPYDGGTHEEAGEARQRLKHRFRPGTVALREIRKLQKTWNNLIPAAAFISIGWLIVGELKLWLPFKSLHVRDKAVRVRLSSR